MISPLRKHLIGCAEILDTARALARRLEDCPDDAKNKVFSRARFNLVELRTEIDTAIKMLDKENQP